LRPSPQHLHARARGDRVVPHTCGGETSSDTEAPCEGRHWHETRAPVRGSWRRRGAHATTQPSGQWTVGVHVTCDMTCWLPQTDATLAQAERRESWDTPSGFGV